MSAPCYCVNLPFCGSGVESGSARTVIKFVLSVQVSKRFRCSGWRKMIREVAYDPSAHGNLPASKYRVFEPRCESSLSALMTSMVYLLPEARDGLNADILG